MAAEGRICGLCGQPFALAKPDDAEETERDGLCPTA